MTTELFYLLLTAILTAVLWIPHVMGMVRTRGLLQPKDYVVAPTSPLPHWVDRANRAHMNAVENLAPFTAIVVVGHLAQVHTGLTAGAAVLFFYARALHAVVHLTGFKHARARTVIFTIGWFAMMTIAAQILIHAA